MRDLLVEWGVPSTAILIETKSLNTYQNAINVKPILESHNINNVLLVTSAIHMPRALATFQSVGINAIPSPTDYKTLDRNDFSFQCLLTGTRRTPWNLQGIKRVPWNHGLSA